MKGLNFSPAGEQLGGLTGLHKATLIPSLSGDEEGAAALHPSRDLSSAADSAPQLVGQDDWGSEHPRETGPSPLTDL